MLSKNIDNGFDKEKSAGDLGETGQASAPAQNTRSRPKTSQTLSLRRSSRIKAKRLVEETQIIATQPDTAPTSASSNPKATKLRRHDLPASTTRHGERIAEIRHPEARALALLNSNLPPGAPPKQFYSTIVLVDEAGQHLAGREKTPGLEVPGSYRELPSNVTSGNKSILAGSCYSDPSKLMSAKWKSSTEYVGTSSGVEASRGTELLIGHSGYEMLTDEYLTPNLIHSNSNNTPPEDQEAFTNLQLPPSAVMWEPGISPGPTAICDYRHEEMMIGTTQQSPQTPGQTNFQSDALDIEEDNFPR